MQSQVSKNVISLLFLSAFLFLRVANAHTFLHFQDNNVHTDCELCEIITASNEITPFLDQSVEEESYNCLLYTRTYSLNKGYEEPIHCIVTPDVVYNKPPPGY